MSNLYLYPNRTLCSVLEDMRSMHKTRNYSALLACIEEVQYLANKMEAALHDKDDLHHTREKLSDLKREYNKLNAEVEKLKREKPNDA